MTRTKTGRWALLLSACSWATGLGCDLGDAQVPLPIHGGPAQEAELSPVVYQRETRPQAVVSLALTPAAGSACPLAFEAQLPDGSAPSTLVDGDGPRAVDDEGALLSCRVAERGRRTGVFEIDVSALGAELPLLRASGELEETSPGTLELELGEPDQSLRLEATCPSEGVRVLDGAVWFRTLGCQVGVAGGACDVELAAIFENCEP